MEFGSADYIIRSDILDIVVRQTAAEAAEDESDTTLRDILRRWLNDPDALSRIRPLIVSRFHQTRRAEASLSASRAPLPERRSRRRFAWSS